MHEIHSRTQAESQNFKCFSEELQGFETIRRVNVIVGRNNTGKSSLLDLIEAVTNCRMLVDDLGYNGRSAEVILRWPLTAELLKGFWRGDVPTYSNLTSELSQANMLGGIVSSKLGTQTITASITVLRAAA